MWTLEVWIVWTLEVWTVWTLEVWTVDFSRTWLALTLYSELDAVNFYYGQEKCNA